MSSTKPQRGIPDSDWARAPGTPSSRQHIVLFVLVLILGILARTWDFGRLPSGLNPDEASTGVEALSILRHGTDRNGVAFPVKFISWGSGQDVLYAYALLPFIASLGMHPSVIRLPMLASGILALPLMYIAASATFGRRMALMSMFLLAISPWHILLSRWALDSNLLPFVFLLGYVCLMGVRRSSGWLIPACALFALALYSYGTAYAAVPVFLLCTLVILARARLAPARYLKIGALAFILLGAPIGLLVLVNRLGMASVSLGPITVPQFPVPVRWETTTLLGANNVLATIAGNTWGALKLLAVETDGILYNVVEPFGYFYRVGLPLAVLGLGLLVAEARAGARYEILLLFSWLGAAASVAALQEVNINRFNIVFIPLLLCAAFALHWLGTRIQGFSPAVIVILLGAFVAFSWTYHGEPYRQRVAWKFNAGLLPALRFASASTKGGLCVTDKTNMPYIYALFSEETTPEEFLSSVVYVDPSEPLRKVASFGRYKFGTRACAGESSQAYVLTADEIPPRLGNRYDYEFFNNFVVYLPIQ